MSIVELPRSESKKQHDIELSSVSPICIKLLAFIEHKVITTLADLDDFKKQNPSQVDYIDDLLLEFIDKKLIVLDDGEIKPQSPSFWHNLETSEKSIASSFELTKQISKRALSDRKNKVADISLDFSMIVHFADDPEILDMARDVVKRCAKELYLLGEMNSRKDRNKRVRAISFAGSVLDYEGP